jgi:hypothetical protein
MFSKFSRYRKVADITAPDAQGRLLAAKDTRLLPEVSGEFRHTVEAGDRLDQLAYKYYSQPLQWWNICDGNPEFLSPLALLGKDGVITTRFPVTFSTESTSAAPPWGVLLRTVGQILGVEDIAIAEDVELVQQKVTVGGQTIIAWIERFSRAVLVTHNRQEVTAATLAAGIEAAGFAVTQFTDLDQLGQEITIPLRPSG